MRSKDSIGSVQFIQIAWNVMRPLHDRAATSLLLWSVWVITFINLCDRVSFRVPGARR
jgi:hypothetical protein